MAIDTRPPGPRGGLSGVINLTQWKKNGLALLARIASQYGDIALFYIGDYPVYLINHPSLVKQTLVDNYQNLRKPESIKVSNRGYWGDGLTSLDGTAWRRRKRQIQPLFHRSEVVRWSQSVVESTTAMVAGWQSGMTVPLFQELVDLRARISSRIVLGAEVKRADRDTYSGGDEDSISLAEARGQDFVLTTENSGVPFLGMRRPRAGADVGSMLHVIDKHLADPGERADVLSCLIRTPEQDGEHLRPDEITDEILQMYFAGHLTVPTWLARLWYVLAVCPDIDATVYREAKERLKGRLPSMEDLPRLSYVDQVVKETGRFFPPAPILYREVATTFRVGEYVLESGAGLWICPHLLHHDPRNFADPGEFKPQRFASDDGKHAPKYAYLPFGAGPRICIAKAAASAEMQLVLTTVCQHYRLVLSTPLSGSPLALLAMPEPAQLMMRVEARSDID